MRLGAKAAYCRNNLKLNGDVEFHITDNPDSGQNKAAEIDTYVDKKQETSLPAYGLTFSATGKYDFRTIAAGIRAGCNWSSVNNIQPIGQLLVDAHHSDGNLRPGFGPGTCPIFNFDQNPEDRTAGGTAVMRKLSLNAAIDEIGGCNIIGTLDLYDSRFSTIDPRQNWSIGVVFKKIQHVVVGIVGNARAEIGVGVGITLPIATLQFGIFNRLKGWSAGSWTNVFGGNQFRYSVGLEFPPLPEVPRHQDSGQELTNDGGSEKLVKEK